MSGMCVRPPHQNSPFVQLGLHRESSRRRGHMVFTSLFVAESAFCLGAWIHSTPLSLPPLLLQCVPQRAAFSGRGGDAPGGQAGGGGGQVVAEL